MIFNTPLLAGEGQGVRPYCFHISAPQLFEGVGSCRNCVETPVIVQGVLPDVAQSAMCAIQLAGALNSYTVIEGLKARVANAPPTANITALSAMKILIFFIFLNCLDSKTDRPTFLYRCSVHVHS